MTHNELMAMLAGAEIPVAYDHYAEGESPDPPFICFRYPATNHFSADGKAYYLIAQVDVEMYTDLKNPELEARVEDILDAHGIFYDKTEVWIESERLYEVLYTFEIGGNLLAE
ncbi:MAG: hypothetical protein IJV40_06325 [Oscillospiraceae bacterium]|nr:hypothetical protein [Oscillospiraceae bacterium]